MAESRVIINRPNSSSPPPNCAICLGSCTNKCFSDSCMHQFCFKCLLEWSKIKAECPLCKQPFRRIIHNVKSNDEYDEHVVEITPPEEIHIIDNEEFLVLPLGPTSHARHQFHFRTTFTVDTRGEHAIQQMLLTHPLTNGGQISIEGYAPGRSMYRRRRENNTSTSFRRSIYTSNLWVTAPPADVTGRYRDVSPSFFRNCPGARTRLVPWLNRELNALLYENTQLVMRLVDIIMDHLLRHHICSRTFRNLLYEYLDNKTDHFVHEFYNFMRSPFDMIGYDRHIIYTERPHSPAPYIDVSDNDNDSDVIIIGSSNPEDPVVIDLVNTDSDEPIIVSPAEEPQLPLPMPEERYPEPDNRTPVLPLKLRLKHKRQSREQEKEKRRQKRKLHHHRSRSPSTASSSGSEDEYSKSAYERYKRRKKQRKLSKRKPSLSSTDSDLNVEANSREDNLPLSAFISRKKDMKKHKKHDRLYKNFKHNSHPILSYSTKDFSRIEVDRVPQVDIENPNLPSCSKYSSDSSPVRHSKISKLQRAVKKNCSKEQPEANGHVNEDSAGSVNLPSCSKYTYSPYVSSQEGSNNSNLNGTKSEAGTSNDEDYPLTHLVKSEVREVRPEDKNGGPSASGSSSSSGSSNGRLRNILIKKEESNNTWYPYLNYDTDSSEN